MPALSHQPEDPSPSLTIPPVTTRTAASRLKWWWWNFYVLLNNAVWGSYVFLLFVFNRFWRMGSRPKKRLRLRDASRPLKVGIVSEYYFPHTGGLTSDTHYACVVFKQLGHDVKLITSHVAEPDDITQSPHGFEIIRVGRSQGVMANGSMAKISVGWRLGGKIRDLIQREQFDVIHIHCPLMPVLPMLVQLYADCPLVGHLHTVFQKKNIWYRLFDGLVRRVWRDFDGLVAVSETAAKPFEKEYGIKFKVIPNGIPFHHYREPLTKFEAFDDGRINLFFIHRLEPRSGISTVLEAFPLIYREEPRARLIIAGDGPMRKFFEDSVAPELRPHVHFVGTVQKDKPRWFATADINLVPTTRVAALGNTLLESLASGKPSVCSDIPAFRETVSPGEDALFANVDSPSDFAQQTLRIIRDPDLGRRLGAAGRKKIEDHYTWESIIRRVDNYTNEVLGLRMTSSEKLESRTAL